MLAQVNSKSKKIPDYFAPDFGTNIPIEFKFWNRRFNK